MTPFQRTVDHLTRLGYGVSKIARDTGRSTGDVYMALERIYQEKKADPARRTCLRCGRKFPSKWNGHRICKRCKEANERASGALL